MFDLDPVSCCHRDDVLQLGPQRRFAYGKRRYDRAFQMDKRWRNGKLGRAQRGGARNF